MPCHLLFTDRTLNVSLQRPHAYSPHGFRGDLATRTGFDGLLLASHGHHYIPGSYRSYSPVLMRFLGSDRLSPFGAGGLNSYVYCEADPINWRDPTGHNRLQRFLSGFRSEKTLLESPGLVLRRTKQGFEATLSLLGNPFQVTYQNSQKQGLPAHGYTWETRKRLYSHILPKDSNLSESVQNAIDNLQNKLRDFDLEITGIRPSTENLKRKAHNVRKAMALAIETLDKPIKPPARRSGIKIWQLSSNRRLVQIL